MLSEQRHEMILKLLEEKRSVTVTELTRLLNISESTARRDIVLLDKAGRLVKVFGGAVLADTTYVPTEPTVTQKAELNRDEKMQIAKYAASLIQPQDFVYLDAGTTTGYMIGFIEETSATFVTNAVAHAQRLAAKGMHVLLVGGTLKSTTEAVVGTMAALTLKDYHFSKGFFGANGVSRTAGFTTPEANEALVKRTALEQCRTAYILCDNSKFNVVSSVTFAPLTAAAILTDLKPEEFEDAGNIVVC
ncbi:MAG: DeoR/GlpR family DNA-binding transcription regulator [Lachnospiraceae bacterium]|nr:DeoR/GlpR family DNA-binding transcription regulator [Lachnospiraceae bacterium]